MKNYYLAWVGEEEKWYYSMDGFNLKDFPNGYVDYEVTTENGIITHDSYSRDRIGKPFSDFYDKSLWTK